MRPWKVGDMTKNWWAILGVSALSMGCGLVQGSPPETARSKLGDGAADVDSKAKRTKSKKRAKKSIEQRARLVPRKVGDYSVHRFSGSFRSGPLTLIERVVAEEEDSIVIDYTLEDGASDKTLRVTLDRESERPLRVTEVTDDGESEVPLATYEAMLAQTVFTPDINDALIEEDSQTCLVGPKELDCEVKQYRVFVGDQEATLTIAQSDAMPGRDVSGEITAVDGSVIYRAELLEAGNTPAAEDSLAKK